MDVIKEWKKYKLTELGFVGRGKSKHRPRNASILYGGKYPFIQTSEIKKANLYLKDYSKTYNNTGLKQSKLWGKGTLCLTIAANIAETAILGIEACFPDSIIGFIPDKKKSDVRFIKYYIDFIKLKMQSISQGTTQDNLSLEKLQSIDFIVPHIKTQQKIASILSNYDELIENNTKRIKILEEMAQTIYNEWFVKFKFPEHEKVKFVDSEMGKIPEGWEIKEIGDIINCIESGSRPKGGIDPEEKGIPSIGAENILGLGQYNFNKEKYVSLDFFNKIKKGIINSGDLLLYKDGAKIGRKAMFRDNFPHKVCCINEHVFILRTNEKCSQNYLYFYLDSFEITQKIIALNTNAAQPGINQQGVKGLKILIPKKELIDLFDEYIDSNMVLLFNLAKKKLILKQTRDFLLSKLISGELDISKLDIKIRKLD